MSAGRRNLYGLLATFREPEPLTAAAAALRQDGYTRLDAFTPFPVPDLDPIIGAEARAVPWWILAGGVLGAVAAYALILYSVEIDYPINVGGRGLNAWPAYLVLALEAGILGAALAAFVAMLALNRLPTYYHPVFNAPHFTFADDDRFFLLVRRDDPSWDEDAIDGRMRACGAVAVDRVLP
jgi:hypothetical protein